MLANPAFVNAILTEVLERQAAVVFTKRMIWALGAKNDKPAVWARLLDAWEELDRPRNTLQGIEIGSFIILTELPEGDQLEPVANWAQN